MRPIICNIMLACGKGGLEASIVNYTEILLMSSQYTCHVIVDSNCDYLDNLYALNVNVHTIKVRGQYDFLASWRIKRLMASIQPDMTICHGRKAMSYIPASARNKVLCMHNKRNSKNTLSKPDYFIAITHIIYQGLLDEGVPKNKIFYLPNVTRLPSDQYTFSISDPAVIGVLGRCHPVKGFDVFISALAILKKREIEFKAIVAGDGPQKRELESMVKDYGLSNQVNFMGWCKDIESFFRSISILCMSSRIEAFSLTLLEAMARFKPIVTTDTDGPKHLFEQGVDALKVAVNDPKALADALEFIIKNQDEAKQLALSAYKKVTTNYMIDNAVNMIDEIVIKVLRPSEVI